MISSPENRKRLGQVLTPESVAQTLVSWVIRQENERLLDPSCGDGRFVACHRASVGVEIHRDVADIARTRAPWALIHETEFFAWAAETRDRFEAAAGNPPFIRYQHFKGIVRERALNGAARLGARFNGLASSWAPFLVVTAGLLKPGGRMAFVVPAEIGHAPYAIPTLTALCDHFDELQVIAVQEKLFPNLSEDAWLIFARGFGGRTSSIEFSVVERFVPAGEPPQRTKRVSLAEWRQAGCRLRKFLLSADSLSLYQGLSNRREVVRFAEVASVGIGYVSGANKFFHLRPSEARSFGFPAKLLRVTVRKGEQLPAVRVDGGAVREWLRRDEPVLLLDLKGVNELPPSIKRYLDSPAGREVRKGYKCRNRDPWYAVPDVRVPDAFLTYMSGVRPVLVRNDAGCACTNSVHAVNLKPGHSISRLQRAWSNPLVELSCELEGHPLGGGLLKLEPREAANVRLPLGDLRMEACKGMALKDAIRQMRRWRHCA